METIPTVAGRSIPRPSGTVTFLFSDIEGSTVRWDRYRDAMRSALQRHDDVMRSIIEAHAGLVFKTIGDAFCAAFARPRDALTAAYEVQTALAAEDFSAVDGMRVRIAIHSGTCDERDGDYFGPSVNRVARLLAIGHGGQTLVSGATAHLLAGNLPAGTSLRDLGGHRLRDLAEAEAVHQLVAPDLRPEFPPLRSLNALPNNLPAQLSTFFGRDAQIAEIKDLLAAHRLVTLVGAGGVGKSRIALQVGADSLDGSGDGVWFVELAPLTDPTFIPDAIAQALGVQESPNHPMLDTLLAYVRNKHLLLILDNCEHVVAQAASIAEAILRAAPKVAILATSREGFGIGGERTYRMPSLSLPAPSDVRSLRAADALAYEAVTVFVARAQAADQRFRLTDDNAPVVADICRRLDGIALALELAAARMKLLSAKALAEKLNERFRILTGGTRNALPRQKTMRALIDWSYDYLPESERTLFRRLSIFAGEFSLDLAAAVCSDETLAEFEVLDLLGSLVDKSLVNVERGIDDSRYRLLESNRQYAREKLIEEGAFDEIATRHAQAYLRLAEHVDAAWTTTPDRAWEEAVEPELENWRAALEWTLDARGNVAIGQQLAAALRFVWSYFAVGEGRRWIATVRATLDADVSPALAAKLELADAQLAVILREDKFAHAAATRALELFARAGDELGVAEAQSLAGKALIVGRIGDAKVLLQAALGTFRARGLRKLIALTIEKLATVCYFEGDVAGARTMFAESLALGKANGMESHVGQVATNLAEAEFRGGDMHAALQSARVALAIDRKRNTNVSIAHSLANLSAYLVALERWDEARDSAREALSLGRDQRLDVATVLALQHQAAILAREPIDDRDRALTRRRRAAGMLGFVNARFRALGAEREYTEQTEYDAACAALREDFSATELDALLAEGAQWSEDQAVGLALADDGRTPGGSVAL